MTREESSNRPPRLLGLLLDAFDTPPVVRIGTMWVKVHRIQMQEGRAVIELEADDMAVAIEQLVLDSVTAARARAAGVKEQSAEAFQDQWEASSV